MTDTAERTRTCMERMGVDPATLDDGDLDVTSPIDGRRIAAVRTAAPNDVQAAIAASESAFDTWRRVPAPARGDVIRRFAELLREHKTDLGTLVSLENGKILQEGLGEVQEMIDICDFAVGLSRQLYGLTIASERPAHSMRESWHPLGPVAVITAFNFPVAVWSWNTAIAVVCGNPVLWKPSEKTPLTALACKTLFDRAAEGNRDVPESLVQVVVGGTETASTLIDDPRIPLVSATGSCAMGRVVAPTVAARFGRCILELGGNNAVIVSPSADLDMAVRAIVFGAVGTAGQRCTSTRRLFLHSDVYDAVTERLEAAYANVTIGDPLEDNVLVGPLIDRAAFDAMQSALADAKARGARVIGGERVEDANRDAFYVRPALVEMPASRNNVVEETFAPILWVFRYEDLDEAIDRNNAVPQGLSSSIFTTDLREAERFISAVGSDCGIANVNIGTSGAEIGGAFGGEKETGGGRESGSDAWKGYMRRSTSTVNYGSELPLAQGVKFEI